MIDDVDVVIVGGGPVGLWLACELALAKVTVAVLERRSEPVAQSRALLIHSRTLEILALRGLADRFIDKGRVMSSGHFGLLDTSLDLSVLDSGFPFSLLLPQVMTERFLTEHLLELGGTIKRGHLVETVTAQEHGVTVTGKHRAGTQDESLFHFAARYVVGADGARSLVRQAAGIAFSGYPARHMLMLGDVVLDAPPPRPMTSIVNEAGGLLVVPLGDGIHHRIVVIDAAEPPAMPATRAPLTPAPATPAALTMAPATSAPMTPLSLAELAAAASRIAQMDFRPRDSIWLSRFTDETRLAEQYRKGRILLAGDAAHIHAPAGGQGMNVGIQDAMNLGWKLASVIRGVQPERFLDTYEDERHPIGAALRRNTLAQLALITDITPATLALRRMLESLFHLPEVNRQVADELAGFGIAYPRPLLPPEDGWEHRAGISGQRLPDMEIILEDGSRTLLYRLLGTGCWVQLKLSSEAKSFTQAHSIIVVYLAPGAKSGLPDALRAHAASLLLRPDGYLAHIWPARI